MKPQLITYEKLYFKIIEGENAYDVHNKAKEQCPEGYKLKSIIDADDDTKKLIDKWKAE